MIAPAMNTSTEERLIFRELARRQARISRQVEVNGLQRLRPLLGQPGDEHLAVELDFSLDASADVRLNVQVNGVLGLLCNGCAELIAHPIRMTFELCLVTSECRADELAGDCDVMLVDGHDVSIAEIVEDEILLSLPERLCETQPCERAPALSYPAESEQADMNDTPEDTDNPFRILAEFDLKSSDRSDE